MKSKNKVDDMLKEIEKYRLLNGDIPTEITLESLKQQIKAYLNKEISLNKLYSFTQLIFDEVAYTNPINNQLFQAVHDINKISEGKLSPKKAREIILSINNDIIGN